MHPPSYAIGFRSLILNGYCCRWMRRHKTDEFNFHTESSSVIQVEVHGSLAHLRLHSIHQKPLFRICLETVLLMWICYQLQLGLHSNTGYLLTCY